MRYENILNAINSNVWYILPDKMDILLAFLEARINNAEVLEVESRAPTKFKNVRGDIAVMELTGTISQRMGIMDAASGGTSTEAFGAKFDELANDKSIKAIVMDVDSPGGSAHGLEELSSKIRQARKPGRPIIAIANSLMASAAYYVASAADEIVATPGGQVGSIGSIAVHAETSRMENRIGLTRTIIRAPEGKAAANSVEPLSETARAEMQDTVDQYYDMFVSAVAANRGITKTAVKSNYGKGRLLTARDALAAGMVDRIGTLEDVVARLRGPDGFNRRSKARAESGVMKVK